MGKPSFRQYAIGIGSILLVIIGISSYFVYQEHINKVGRNELTLAKAAFENSDFDSALLKINNIPSKSKSKSAGEELRKKIDENKKSTEVLKLVENALADGNYTEAKTHLSNVSATTKAFEKVAALQKEIDDNETGEKEAKLANEAFEQGRFEDMNSHIKAIPATSKAKKLAVELLKKDPQEFKFENFVSPTFKAQEKKYVMLTKQIPAIIVTGKDINNSRNTVNSYIFYYDQKSDNYILGFSMSDDFFLTEKYDVLYGNIYKDDNKNGIILNYYSEGSAWEITSYVIGFDEISGKFLTHLNKSTYKGIVELTDGSFIIQDLSTHRMIKYVWNGKEFEGQKVTIQNPFGLNDIIVSYSISSNDIVQIKKTITVRVGQTITFVREDDTNYYDNFFMERNDFFDWDKQGRIIGMKKGVDVLKIVPNGNNEKAVLVMITVTD
ncbi:hypothetical protein [Paenibacillus sp. MBLB4367]|uniref:hypothetical protein n=1 Tax=Paenibacillus sp. MBLB4367 TaxID=3384767 RepID=UPI003908031E